MSYKHNKKWRLSHTEKRNKDRKKYYAQFRERIRKYRRWNNAEIDLVMLDKFSDRVLHVIVNRSVQAIQVKRCELMKGG